MMETPQQIKRVKGTIPKESQGYKGVSSAVSAPFGEVIIMAKDAVTLEKAMSRVASSILHIDQSQFKETVILAAHKFVESGK